MDYFKELQGFADRIRSIEPSTYFSRIYQVGVCVETCGGMTINIDSASRVVYSSLYVYAVRPWVFLHTIDYVFSLASGLLSLVLSRA